MGAIRKVGEEPDLLIKKIVPAPMSTVAIRLLKVCCMCCVCAQYCVVSVRRTRSPVSPRPSTLIR